MNKLKALIELEQAATSFRLTAPVDDDFPEVMHVFDGALRACKNSKDSGFLNLVLDAYSEANKAMHKFPQPNYVLSKFAEESGEVIKEAIHCAEGRGEAENLRNEIKQAIAMLIRLWIEGDQVHGLSPVSALTKSEGKV